MPTQNLQNSPEVGSLVNPWVRAARPETLTAAVVPVVVGTAVAAMENIRLGLGAELHFERMLLALVSACAIQVGTNYFNDAIDFCRGADTTNRLGPPRATQLGLLTAQQMMRGAWAAFFIAVITGAVLVAMCGPVILAIGLLSLLFGYAYTGGPFPLAYRGLGDVFVLLFFGIVAVMGSTYLQLASWPSSSLLAGIQVGLLAVVLIAINNFRDSEGDRMARKYTLAVLLGEKIARYEIVVAAVLPFILGFGWLLHDALWAAVLPLAALPLLGKVIGGAGRLAPSAACNGLLVTSAKMHALFGALLAAGLLLSALWR